MTPPFHPRASAFTLVEVLVSSVILAAILGFMVTVSDQTSRIMRSTTGKVEQFRDARTGFERITTRLSQATLNTYWDYDSATAPTRYERRSELRFVSGDARTLLGDNGSRHRLGHCVFFNAPLGLVETDTYRGLGNVLNTVGYFIEFGDDSLLRPDFITKDIVPLKWRWRLMEFAQPTEEFSVYRYTSGNSGKTYTATTWFKDAVNATDPTKQIARVMVENVVALIITPRLPKAEEAPSQGGNSDTSPLAPDYRYDSTSPGPKGPGGKPDNALNWKNQLPPIVQVTMVAIDEKSADRLALDDSKWDLPGVSAKFTSTANFTSDLSLDSANVNSLEKKLIALKAQYRIFTTKVPIRGAKWSREQTD